MTTPALRTRTTWVYADTKLHRLCRHCRLPLTWYRVHPSPDARPRFVAFDGDPAAEMRDYTADEQRQAIDALPAQAVHRCLAKKQQTKKGRRR